MDKSLLFPHITMDNAQPDERENVKYKYKMKEEISHLVSNNESQDDGEKRGEGSTLVIIKEMKCSFGKVSSREV